MPELKKYKQKRKWPATPEPEADINPKVNNKASIQLHHAHKAGKHYDWRFGQDGVLKSFVTRSIPAKGERVTAIKTEDHPASYLTFEGEIPEGHYGEGTVELYDLMDMSNVEWKPKKISFDLSGKKVSGHFTLIPMADNKYLMIRS